MNRPDKTREIVIWFITIGVCITLAKCAFSQCQTYEFEYPEDSQTMCFDAPLQVTTPFTPSCPPWYLGGGYIIKFSTDGNLPTKIIVEGDINYTFAPDQDIFVHAFILEECYGDVVWSTSSCWKANPLYWSGLSQDWMLCINLPAGSYFLTIGNVGLWQIQNDIEGCIDVMIFQDGFLGLGIIEHNGLIFKEIDYLYNILGQRTK